MVEDRENRQLGNLVAGSSNPLAAQAMLRRQGGVFKPQLLGSAIQRPGVDSEFESMMAVNNSQNNIISDVLDGPVSQQTQRQLAQLQAMNQQNPKLETIAKSNTVSAEQPIEAPVKRGPRNLQAGHTIIPGTGKGKIFNTAQMAAYQQKYGYQLRLPSKAQPIVQEAAYYMEEEKERAMEGMSDSAIAAVNDAIMQNQMDLYPELRGSQAKSADEENIHAIINRVGLALDLDPNLIKAVVKAESNYNPKAVSHAGAQGLMQLMPRTAKEMGVKDPFDPLENIWGGARYLKSMLERHGGNINKALAAYNWGPGNLDRHGYGNGQNLPRETRRYIEVVNRNYNRYKTQTSAA
jgi:hypothetical protein